MLLKQCPSAHELEDQAPGIGAEGVDADSNYNDEGGDKGDPAADDESIQSDDAAAAAADSSPAHGVEDARPTLVGVEGGRQGPSQGLNSKNQRPGSKQGLDGRPGPSQGLDDQRVETIKSSRNTGIFGNTQGMFPRINQSKVLITKTLLLNITAHSFACQKVISIKKFWTLKPE